ncbi:MAG TPA: hypothetical protein VN282_14625 [Pyrinomonadaceae bacterium]|nr:hypothetical protein [Pyrinomonadaceae bacterium]
MRPHSQRETRRPANATSAEAGFTILETVIALFIALVVGFGAISLFLFSTSFNTGASERARALAVAQQKMEQVRTEDYDDLAAGTTTETVESGDYYHNDLRTFSVETTVENDETTTPVNRQKKITVSVTPETEGNNFSAGAVTVSMLRASDELGEN